jgi:purine-cytosine permease-like protein
MSQETENITTSGSIRRLDKASLALLIVGVVCAIAGIFMIINQNVFFIILLPALIAIYSGAKNITKLEAPRD